MSCLPSSIGADTYLLRETQGSRCQGYRVATGGGKSHELGAKILGLGAAANSGESVNLLARFRAVDSGRAVL